MKIHQLRNATMILSLGEHQVLVDPMLADPGTLPAFKLRGAGRRPNPLVPLPAGAAAALDEVTAVLVTHEHPDHLDRDAVQWIRDRQLPVWASPIDAASLRRKGLPVEVVGNGLGGMAWEVVPTRHGRGLLGWLMGPVSGYVIAHPAEPTVYLTADAVLRANTVLTTGVLETIDRLQPAVIVAPAGAANFGIGRDILFSIDELVTLVRQAPGVVVLNHLQALDHCPTTRAELQARMDREGLAAKIKIPEDGEQLSISPTGDHGHRPLPADRPHRRPGLQKWLTANLSGT